MRQTLRIGSMAINDGIHEYLMFAFDSKDQRKTQTQMLSVNKALNVSPVHRANWCSLIVVLQRFSCASFTSSVQK